MHRSPERLNFNPLAVQIIATLSLNRFTNDPEIGGPFGGAGSFLLSQSTVIQLVLIRFKVWAGTGKVRKTNVKWNHFPTLLDSIQTADAMKL